MEKYRKLTERSGDCLIKTKDFYRKLQESSEAENDIRSANEQVSKYQNLLKYFQTLHSLLKEVQGEDEFVNCLQKQNWKGGLDKLISLSDNAEGNRDDKASNIAVFKNEIVEMRLRMFHENIEKRIKTLVDELGWPKIVSNEETAEIISRLQELLTYGEALYILSSKSTTMNLSHPLAYFIDPIKLRFDFHFNSDKATNKLDHPEWFFDHLLMIGRECVSFMREFLLPCWRLRDLTDFLRESLIDLSVKKTRDNLRIIREDSSVVDQGLVIHHLMEMGKFLKTIQDEFGVLEIEGIIEDVFIENNGTDFVEKELERIQVGYSIIMPIDGDNSDWIPSKGAQRGEPSAPVIKFLSFFHRETVQPYSFFKKDMKLKASLLVKVQTWLLEEFHDKCLFACPPLHSTADNILTDMALVNSLTVLCGVLRDDFGESLDSLELSSSAELKEIIGYDASLLPGTCFNKAIAAFKAISDKLSSQIFNYAMEKFLNPATKHANSMVYARVDEPALLENLRLAVANLTQVLALIQPVLGDKAFHRLFHQTLPEKLAAFMFQGVLLKNFFNEAGAEAFHQDLQYIQSSLSSVLDPVNLKLALAKVFEASEILKIKERDPTGPFDGARLARAVKEQRTEELKRILELLRCSHLRVDELPQIFASRRHRL